MYIIINKTQNTKIRMTGNFPLDQLEEQLNNGDQLIVISLYSNTIKVPQKQELNGEIEWNFLDYPLITN